MQFRGLYPSGAFLLVLIGTVLFLLSREPGHFGWGTHPVAPHDWVCLTDPEVGSSFHSFQAGQMLGPLVAKELPRLSQSACGPVPANPPGGGDRDSSREGFGIRRTRLCCLPVARAVPVPAGDAPQCESGRRGRTRTASGDRSAAGEKDRRGSRVDRPFLVARRIPPCPGDRWEACGEDAGAYLL